MSLFSAGFWIPSSVQFGTTFLDTGLNLYDSLISTLIVTLFSGIQLCMCRRISQLHLRLAASQHRTKHQRFQGLFLGATSILIAGLWISGALIYCVQFSRNLLTLRGVGRAPGNLAADSAVRACSRPSDDPFVRCFDVPLSRLEMGRRMELAFATLAQILVFITDSLLVLRCYIIFNDTPWVYITAALSFVASIAVWIFGLASLGRAGALGSSSWNWTFSADGDNLPAGFSLSMSMVSSLVVNATVTVAIVYRVLAAKRRLQRDSLPVSHGGNDDVYSTAAALLIESALPPVIFGIIASIFSSESVVNQTLAFEFRLIPKIAWLAFTALAPQLILVRILQGRAWSSSESFTSIHTSNATRTSMAPISFSAPPSEGTGHRQRPSSSGSWGDEEASVEKSKRRVMYQ